MMLKIETSKGVLDLGGELTLQVEEKSPVMNERGSQSLPATVPATPRNMLIMGFPHRLDGVEVPLAGDKSCMVSDGVYHRRGVMNLVNASRSEGITLNVGFDNSEAYEAWKKRRLNELSLPVLGEGDVEDLADLLQDAYDHGGGDDFAVFPIAVAREEISSNNVNTVYWGLLNCVENGVLVWRARTQEQPVDGTVKNVSLPSGYGVTGFLYVWRVLELAFADLGYMIDSNPFKGTDAGDLAQLVVLNNVADAICTGYLNYSDLMPDCEVQAFLQALKVRFGLIYLLNQDTRRVRIELIKDIIVQRPINDLTAWQTEWPMVSYETRKQLKLSAKTSLYNAAPVNERLEDYVKTLPLSSITTAEEFDPNSMVAHPSAFILERVTGKLYKWDENNHAYSDSISGFFSWDPQTNGVETEELSSEDECVPMVNIEGRYLPGYITGAVHRHTYIKGCENDKEKNETPLAFVISYGQEGRITPPADATGKRLSLLFQWGDGLFSQFWMGYDDLLRRAFNKVEVSMRMSAVNLLKLDLLKPVKYQGQPMLIDGFDYTLPMLHNVQVSMIMRTMRPVGDSAAEQIMPDIGPSTPTWKWVFYRSNIDEQIERLINRLMEQQPEALPELVPGDYGDAWQTDEEFSTPPTGPGSVWKDYEASVGVSMLETDEQGRTERVTRYFDVQYTVGMIAEYS